MTSIPSIATLVVAAGRGQRLGDGLPKQYRLLGGVPLLRRTLLALLQHPAYQPIQVVIHPEDLDAYRAATHGMQLLPPVFGGATRQDSVLAGLQALAAHGAEYVAVHDAARPFPSHGLLQRLAEAVTQGAVVPAVPLTDCIKTVNGEGKILRTEPREKLRRIQTPQLFPFGALLAAHQAARGEEMPDDAAVAEAAGLTVHTVAGEEANRKLTTPEDWHWAEDRLAAKRPLPRYRTGHGYDVHALEHNPSKPLKICGITIPFDRTLKGHSDADVGLHALVDAMLGTIGREDIGFHFSPKDERWREADSRQFVTHALQLLAEAGGRLEHLDITLVGEAPKFGPHRQAMREALAELCSLPLDAVSVKATTTEKLGFTGREEGLAALATVTVALP